MIVKRIDNLGRLCIPTEYRKMLGIESNDYVYIECNDKQITIKKKNLKNKYDCLNEKVLTPLSNSYNFKLLLMDKKNILYSTDPLLINLYVPESLKKYFNAIPEIFKKMHLSITNNICFNKVSYIFPILEDGYTAGLIVINTEKDLKHEHLMFLYHLINN